MTQPRVEGYSRARGFITLSRKGNAVTILLGEDDAILFLHGFATAVSTGGSVYFLDLAYKSSETKAINAFADAKRDRPVVKVRVAEQFDFIVGSVLSKAGLPLTMRRD
jgi:hypothetical protein